MYRSVRLLTLALALASVAGVAPAGWRVAGASSGSTPEVTLLTSGRSPRSALRLALGAGAVSQGTLEFRLSVRSALDGAPRVPLTTPPARIPTTVTVESVEANGDALVSTSFGDVTVVDDGTIDSATREQYEETLTALSNATTTATRSPQNELRDVSPARVTGADPFTTQQLAQFSDRLGSVPLPLPREPIGVGARWQSRATSEVGGIRIDESYEYTMRERDDSRVVVDLEYLHTAPRQRVTSPEPSLDGKAELTRYRVVGRGTVTVDLADALPVESTVHASGRRELRIRSGGVTNAFSQKLVVDMLLTRTTEGRITAT